MPSTVAAYILAKEDARLTPDSGVPASWERANAEFHRALVSACGSNWLLKARDSLQDQCDRYRRASVNRGMGARDLLGEHKAIAEAVLARDADRACELLERHFALTAENLAPHREGGEAE